MPSYPSLGVYVEEISSGSKPIECVGASVTAFVGETARGDVGEAILIHRWRDYEDTFGSITSESDSMGLAVSSFYLNGGKDAYICRLDSARSPATEAEIDVESEIESANVLKIKATSPGDWANGIYVRIVKPSSDDLDFTLELGYQIDGAFAVEESFSGLNMDKESDDYVLTQVNGSSQLVNVVGTASSEEIEQLIPKQMLGDDNAGKLLTPGTYSSPDSQDYKDFFDQKLKEVRDVSIIVLPGKTWGQTSSDSCVSEAISHCEATKSRMVIIDPPQDHLLDQELTVNNMNLPISTYGVLYYPWIKVLNPLYHAEKNPNVSKVVSIAPSALASGIWAKTDRQRGVWKAPAGLETGLVGVDSLQYVIEDSEQDCLNPLGVNCLRKVAGSDPVIWGSRTLATKAYPEWRYVPFRRTVIMIEQSIYKGIQWAVFEPNDEALWSSLQANIGSFMNELFRAGAFQAQKTTDAYFVRCSHGDTMTQGEIDAGQVIIIVGFAPVKPAEFVIVRIQLKINQQ